MDPVEPPEDAEGRFGNMEDSEEVDDPELLGKDEEEEEEDGALFAWKSVRTWPMSWGVI